MNLIEYQQQTLRTCPSLGNNKLDLCHMVLGMVSELPELYEAGELKDKNKVGDEATDIQWYLSNYCNLRNYSLDAIYNSSYSGKSYLLENAIYNLTDKVKKYIAYDKPINETDEKDLIRSIIIGCKLICDNYHIDFFLQLGKNIEKLKVRFPDKFTKELAINRDLEAERKTLEQ